MIIPDMDIQTMYATWGRKMRNRREELKLTQGQLADLCRQGHRATDQATISRIEKGLQAPPDDLKFAISASLGMSVKELFDYADAPGDFPRRETNAA